jgi:putative membrane protein
MSTKKILTGLVCGALSCIPALAQAQTATATPADSEFVTFAGQTDMTEAHLGQLAQEQATGQEIKDYGQMLTQDHTKDYDALTAVASKIGAEVPKGIDAAHNKMIDPLAKLKGRTFDHRFLAAMVKGHEEAITKYKKEADSGDNAALKAYASSARPTLQQHLEKAQDLMRPAAHKK